MAEPLTNPLFEDEKEFLERQKLEYERALLGEVEDIKEKTQQVGKYVAIGAGLLGSVWLISKALGVRKNRHEDDEDEDEDFDYEDSFEAADRQRRAQRVVRSLRNRHAAHDHADLVTAADDLGFGRTAASSPPASEQTYRGPVAKPGRAQLAPDVYHATAATLPAADFDADPDPFQPLSSNTAVPRQGFDSDSNGYEEEHSSMASSAIRAFLHTNTGKMLVGQAAAVLVAVAAKKLNDYLPMLKNPDLADAPAPAPVTQDVDFTLHDDDANAPHQPL